MKEQDHRRAYGAGVPMGSDLPASPKPGLAPTFVLWALKDPNNGALDRIQVVKVWLEGGDYKEKVFNVALSGGRRSDPRTGRAPAVGDTRSPGMNSTCGLAHTSPGPPSETRRVRRSAAQPFGPGQVRPRDGHRLRLDRQLVLRAVPDEDQAGPEEADPRHDLRGDPGRVQND